MEKKTKNIENICLKIGSENLVINQEILKKSQPDIEKEIIHFGNLLGKAKEIELLVEAEYRNWKAKLGLDILTKEPKLAEWKIRQQIESTSNFMLYRKGIAKAKSNTVLIETMLDLLKSLLSCDFFLNGSENQNEAL